MLVQVEWLALYRVLVSTNTAVSDMSLYNDQRPDDWTWTSHDSPPDQVSFGRLLRSNEKEGLMEEVA